MATLRPGLPRFTLDDPANANLVALGFEPVTADAAAHAWKTVSAVGQANPD